MSDIDPNEWPPEKKALASQWLIEKRLDRIRANMPPEAFSSLANSLDHLLSHLEDDATIPGR